MRPKLSDRTIALLILLTFATVLLIERLQAAQQNEIPLSTTSDADQGASALASWLAEMEYEVVTSDVLTEFAVPAGTDVIFMLEPIDRVTASEHEVLNRWVNDGGTMIVSGQAAVTAEYLTNFNLTLQPNFLVSEEAADEAVELPLMTEPIIEQNDDSALFNPVMVTDQRDMVIHARDGSGGWLITQEAGRGRYIFVSRPQIFTNQGLLEENNRQVTLNIIGLIDPGAIVWFNEWHHGLRLDPFDQERLSGPADWLRFTAPGRSLLFGLLVIFVFLALSGRRLGRAEPPREEIRRRRAVEYVQAIADLTRRIGRQDELQTHYYHRLKRILGRRYRLDPQLGDEAYAADVAAYAPQIDPQELAQLLNQLRIRKMNEKELIEAAQKVDEYENPGRRT